MPVLSHQGAAAPCGITATSRSCFGGGDHVVACYFNLHKVVLHELESEGATYFPRDIELLSCDHPDFHPTDVFEDADGSLLIVEDAQAEVGAFGAELVERGGKMGKLRARGSRSRGLVRGLVQGRCTSKEKDSAEGRERGMETARKQGPVELKAARPEDEQTDESAVPSP